MVASVGERPGEPGERPDPKLGVVVAEQRNRLLEQLDGARLGDPGTPAGVLVPDRRAREQLGVTELPGDSGRRFVRLERVLRLAREVIRAAELEVHGGPLLRLVDSERDRGAQQGHRLVERERCLGGAGRAHVVVDGASHVRDRRRSRVVVGEVAEDALDVALVDLLQRLSDPEVELRTPCRSKPIEERPAHELVGEAAREAERRHVLCQAGSRCLVEGAEQLRFREGRGALEDPDLEHRPDDGGELEELGRRGRKPCEPLADDLAYSLRSPEPRERPREPDACGRELERAGLDQRAPELGHQEGVAVRQLGDRAGDPRKLGAGLAARRVAHEVRDLVARKPVEPQPDDAFRPAKIRERLRERLAEPPPRCPGTLRAAACATPRPPARDAGGAGARRRRPSGRPPARAAAAGHG